MFRNRQDLILTFKLKDIKEKQILLKIAKILFSGFNEGIRLNLGNP